MGSVPVHLADELREAVGLRRAVETGTFHGDGARRLARLFPEVVTIELSDALHEQAKVALADVAHVQVLHGRSPERLAELADGTPTLYWLDAHWSLGETAGADAQCPLIDEVRAIGAGNSAVDCILIDDARLFMAPPPPPADPAQWPALAEVMDALREIWPGHFIAVAHDLVIAVPEACKPAVERFAWHTLGHHWPLPQRVLRHALLRVLTRLDRRGF